MIPRKHYAFIVANVPILCIDLLVSWRSKYLLVKRENEPLAGKFWPPGGRVLRGEHLAEAVTRILEAETGIESLADAPERFPGTFEGFFKKTAANPRSGIHTVSIVYRMRLPNDVIPAIRLDEQSSAYKWSYSLPAMFVRNLTTL